jgi:hypothetical protein
VESTAEELAGRARRWGKPNNKERQAQSCRKNFLRPLDGRQPEKDGRRSSRRQVSKPEKISLNQPRSSSRQKFTLINFLKLLRHLSRIQFEMKIS